MKRLFLIALCAAAAAAPTPAIANPSGPTILVRYSDLDLGTSEGRTTLDRRVKRAVRHACDFAGPVSVDSQERVSDCVAQAWKDVRPQVQLALRSSPDVLGEQASR
jgi:UrcA family protein